MNFATKKAYFPTNRVIKEHFCFPRMCTSQNFDFLLPNLFRSFSLALFFFFSFLLHQQFFFLPRICMELWLANFQERDKFSFYKVVGKQQNWQWIFPQIVTFFRECNVVRISQKIQNQVSLEIFSDVVAYRFILAKRVYNLVARVVLARCKMRCAINK